MKIKYDSFEDWKKHNQKAYTAAKRKGWISEIKKQFWIEEKSEYADDVDRAISKMIENENALLERQLEVKNFLPEEQPEDKVERIESKIEEEVISRIWDDSFLRNLFRTQTYLSGTYITNNKETSELDIFKCKCDFAFSTFDIMKMIECYYEEDINGPGIYFYTKSKNTEELIDEAVKGVGHYTCMRVDEEIGNCTDEPTHSCKLILKLIPVKVVDKNLSYKENIIQHIKNHAGLMRFFGAYFLSETYWIPESTHYNITSELIEELIRKEFDDEKGFAYGHIDLNRDVTVENLEDGLDRLIHGMKFGICEWLSDSGGDYYHSDYLHIHKYDISEMISK